MKNYRLELEDENPYPKNLRKLAMAVIENALHYSNGNLIGDFTLIDKSKQELIDQAKKWIDSDDNQDMVGSFSWCCEILQVNRSNMRLIIKNHKYSKNTGLKFRTESYRV